MPWAPAGHLIHFDCCLDPAHLPNYPAVQNLHRQGRVPCFSGQPHLGELTGPGQITWCTFSGTKTACNVLGSQAPSAGAFDSRRYAGRGVGFHVLQKKGGSHSRGPSAQATPAAAHSLAGLPWVPAGSGDLGPRTGSRPDSLRPPHWHAPLRASSDPSPQALLGTSVGCHPPHSGLHCTGLGKGSHNQHQEAPGMAATLPGPPSGDCVIRRSHFASPTTCPRPCTASSACQVATPDRPSAPATRTEGLGWSERPDGPRRRLPSTSISRGNMGPLRQAGGSADLPPTESGQAHVPQKLLLAELPGWRHQAVGQLIRALSGLTLQTVWTRVVRQARRRKAVPAPAPAGSG